ncbi:hypothetical protein A1O3_04631 [Capronia epimyces CBS 606.96]|uniref:Xylanolytic transcriptional activator regulatory domain-containing protein n=1 Tax=Capronia epimyces CBS 606.96 TaxID=1182542 RepID=W9YNX4_9EURO|nr:uncharacterized protein A1O3_04631 [Capronia epimyces CBS 606.96]EXJ83964.1 hypothetical protein A1O3_04631 [Capronia epimyces CBS 606.96]
MTMGVEYLRQQYFRSVGVYSTIIAGSSEQALVMLYFTHINPLLPLIDRAIFEQQYREGKGSPHLIRAICLVALRLASAAPYIQDSSPEYAFHLSQVGESIVRSAQGSQEGDYRNLTAALDLKLYTALRAAVIEGNLESDRICRIRILALMSLAMPFSCDNPDEGHRSTWYLHQAITEAQSLGLHVKSSSMEKSNPCTQRLALRCETSQADTALWWSLYVLDRLGTITNPGKPYYIQDRDIGLERPRLQGSEPPDGGNHCRCPLAAWIDQIGTLEHRFKLRISKIPVQEGSQLEEWSEGSSMGPRKPSQQEINAHELSVSSAEVFASTYSYASCRVPMSQTLTR